MNEHYLHYLWKNKLIPFHKLTLSDGTPFEVKNTGSWNRYGSGPDFLNATINMHGLTWVGDVEIHVSSSDWYSHKHHLDQAYNAVILHVVYTSNAEVKIQNTPIPELALDTIIDKSHFLTFSQVKMKPKLYCSNHLSKLNQGLISQSFKQAFISRMKRKSNSSSIQYKPIDSEQLYINLAMAFGGKLNQSAFLELIRRVSIHLFLSLNEEMQHRIFNIISGFHPVETKSDAHLSAIIKSKGIEIMPLSHWKKGGVYFSASPKKRVAQFSFMIRAIFTPHVPHAQNEIFPPDFKRFTGFIMQRSHGLNWPISFLRHVFINAIIPFYISLNAGKGLAPIKIGHEALKELPPEMNHIVELWIKAGLIPKNAFESQAMLEIYTDFCSSKKCLSCSIGQHVLKV